MLRHALRQTIGKELPLEHEKGRDSTLIRHRWKITPPILTTVTVSEMTDDEIDTTSRSYISTCQDDLIRDFATPTELVAFSLLKSDARHQILTNLFEDYGIEVFQQHKLAK